jgi:hypothetical protein
MGYCLASGSNLLQVIVWREVLIFMGYCVGSGGNFLWCYCVSSGGNFLWVIV